MRRLKVSIICSLAVLLCCTFALLFIGLYNSAQEYSNTPSAPAAEITRPEHDAQKTADSTGVHAFGFSTDGLSQYNILSGYTYQGKYYITGLEVAYTGETIFVSFENLPLGTPGVTLHTTLNSQMQLEVKEKRDYTVVLSASKAEVGPGYTYTPMFAPNNGSQVTLFLRVKDLGLPISPTVSYNSTMTYGGTQTLGVTGNTGGGAVTWTLTNGTGSATLSSTTSATPVLTATQAGYVTLKANVAASGNYLAGQTSAVTVTINKAGQTPSISGSGSVAYGSSITLSGSGQGGLS